MGRVFLAGNQLMDRLEVLKVLKDERLTRPGADDRFQRRSNRPLDSIIRT